MGDDHSRNSTVDQSIGAGRRFAVMGARFESDKRGRTVDIVWARLECMNLGVGPAELAVPAFANEATILNQDAANHRIGFDTALASPCQFQRPLHPGSVRIFVGHVTLSRQFFDSAVGVRKTVHVDADAIKHGAIKIGEWCFESASDVATCSDGTASAAKHRDRRSLWRWAFPSAIPLP
jgi:hypothetical protein